MLLTGGVPRARRVRRVGALAAVRARLDVFGVVVVGLITALVRGHPGRPARHPPPTTLPELALLAVCAVTALVVFVFHPQVARLRRGVLLADALGLGVFATAGTTIALNAGRDRLRRVPDRDDHGIGGGAVRDLLLREIPWCCEGDLRRRRARRVGARRRRSRTATVTSVRDRRAAALSSHPYAGLMAAMERPVALPDEPNPLVCSPCVLMSVSAR